MVALQTDPSEAGQAAEKVLKDVCGSHPSTMCERILDATDNHALARASDIVFGGIGKILFIVVLAWVVNRLVRRAIDRFTARVTNPNAASDAMAKLRRRAPAAVSEATSLSTRATARAKTMAGVLRSVASAVIWAIAA